MKKVNTGMLNYFVDVDKIEAQLEKFKGIKHEILKFRPSRSNRKAYMRAYNKFLTHKDTLDLTKFGFRADTTTSPSFGTKTFYKPDEKDFFWAELFEAVHLGLV